MIKRLEKNLSEYIKAQQYIQNTYTIVKELVENSLDAGATVIKTIVTEKDIVVDDDGQGIEDLELIGNEHVTSKEFTSYSVLGLNKEANKTSTNGYRGMALNSIKNLCDIEITTKHKSNKSAYRKCFINGQCSSESDKTSRNQGTCVKVYNIFRDCNIRRNQNNKNLTKYVKKIGELLEAYACVNEVHFVFYYLNKQILNIRGHKTLEDHINNTYKDDVLRSLVVDSPSYYLFVLPYVEKKPIARLFLNKRIVDSFKIKKMIKETFNLFNEGTPTFYLNFKESADFNLSADKSEFVLTNENEVKRKIKTDIIRFFREHVYIKGTNHTDKEKIDTIHNEFNPEDTYQKLFDDALIDKSIEVIEEEENLSPSFEESTPEQPPSLDYNTSSFLNSPILKRLTPKIASNLQYSSLRENVINEHKESFGFETQNETKIENEATKSISSFLQNPKSDKFNAPVCDKLDLETNAFSYLQFVKPFGENLHLKKEDFAIMNVLGQFNSGFILAALKKDNRNLIILVD